MLPIPKGTKEEEKKGIRPLTCPYCDDNPNVKILTDESLAYMNEHFDKIYNKKHNYDRGVFCDKCKTTWLWEGNVADTYVGKDVPRIREVVIINGKACLNFLPIKDWETREYMPLLHPLAPLIKKPK